MTNDEIREAVDNKYGTTETQLKVLKELAEEYLSIKGWPEELSCYCPPGIGEIYCSCGYENFNDALRLCKLAAMKEKNRVSREAIKEAISGSNLAFYAENEEWVDELYDALLELINGKEA